MTTFLGSILYCPPAITPAVYYIYIFRLPTPTKRIRLQLQSKMVRLSMSWQHCLATLQAILLTVRCPMLTFLGKLLSLSTLTAVAS